MQTLSWLFALSLILMAIASAASTVWVLRARRVRSKALPTEWDIAARAVFNNDERRVYRQLRDALPHHIVLAKLPLLRFSQAEDPQRMKYWYRVLGQLNVTFAICGANGRLLAALDLDNGRSPSHRTLKIKQSVLAACRVRYLRLPSDHLPSIAELQLLVPQMGSSVRAPQRQPAPARVSPPARAPAMSTREAPAFTRHAPYDAADFTPSTFRNPMRQDSTFGASTFGASTFGASTMKPASLHDSSFGDSSFEEAPFPPATSRPAAPTRPPSRAMTSRDARGGVAPSHAAPRPQAMRAAPRPAHTPLWQDSNFFQDSFFGSDDRPDLSMPSGFGSFGGFDSDLLPPPPAPSPRRIASSGRASAEPGPQFMHGQTRRTPGALRHPIRTRPHMPGELGVSDTDIVGVVVDTHDVRRPAARRLASNRDVD